jgi:hypothetical protein
LFVSSSRKAITAPESFLTTSAGRPAGPTSAYQPGSAGICGASSLTSGIAGMRLERLSPDCASATTVPASYCGRAVTVVTHIRSVSPETTDISAGPEPL